MTQPNYHRKSTWVRYFETKRVDYEYRPLKTPKVERTAWFFNDDGTESGYFVSKSEYDRLNVPETNYDPPGDRQSWESAQKRRQHSGKSSFCSPW
jgi:hypothetical protein